MPWIIAVVTIVVLARLQYERSRAVRWRQNDRLSRLEDLNAEKDMQSGEDTAAGVDGD